MKRSSIILAGLLAFATLVAVSSVRGDDATGTTNTTSAVTPHKVKGKKGKEAHPSIHKAIVAIEAAKKDLERANHDFGGHRKLALEDCDKAIAQLKLAAEFDHK